MSWRDAKTIDEPATDCDLRDELQNMLGLAPVQHPPVSSTPDTVALAQTLYREAMRRRRTAPEAKGKSKGRFFVLIAATIPFLFTATALGTWGVKQKRRADALAAKTLELESRQNRLDSAREGVRNRENQQILQASDSNPAVLTDSTGSDRNSNMSGELIKPDERPNRLNSQPDQYRVNDNR
ncbi:MAG: hypothetical protein FWG12_03300 [Holophagaceae bacterium]|nr:hypothetical protein [Holophagaceae bacterium]